MGFLEVLKGEEPGPITNLFHFYFVLGQDVGAHGEYLIEYALGNHNLEGNYRIYKNVYIPHGDTTSEIDLLLLHEKGIFVLESKNYSGWIFGDTDQVYWTQSLQKKKSRFYNPIRQNRTHVQALAAYFDKPETEFTSYIIFSKRCELKHVPASTDDIVVIKRPQMLTTLRKTLRSREVRYSADELSRMGEKLASCVNKSVEEKQQHVEEIQQQYDTMICPFCGKQLVERKGKHGAFLGCSGYPKCHYTRPIHG